MRTLTRRTPSEFGFETERWTAAILIQVFRREFGSTVPISESKISRLRAEVRTGAKNGRD
jgi:hypothetical protein